jgi:pantoate--beta-alanine ligase
MGSLHEGHLSLVRIAKKQADKVIVSIFVNPTQFGPREDLAAYPRNETRDLSLCEQEGVDAVFLPTPTEMYASDASVTLAESTLSKTLCGRTRPSHFQGVLTVVNKLFNISRADVAVFGMKDAQQLAVIQRMVRDLDIPIQIIPAPILREADGLAISSRNAYLTPEQRQQALCLRRALDLAETAWLQGHTALDPILAKIRTVIEETPETELDYIAAVDAATLTPVTALRTGVLIALAVKIGHTRLIDNTVLSSPKGNPIP